MPRASSNITRASRRILYCAVGAAILSIPTLAIADETFVPQAAVSVPGKPLLSFDISWVDAALHKYFLADRSNASIDVINTHSKNISQIIPTGPDAFAGAVLCPSGAANDCAGPNGVLTIPTSGHGDHDHDGDDRNNATVWAGDGPTPQSKATTGATCAATPPGSVTPLNGSCSTVKIFQLGNNDPIRIIPTNGQARADELCYDPNDHLVMIANDADSPPFVTFISTEGNNRVLGQITFPEAKGGIEQCQWDPRNGNIYVNLPAPANGNSDGWVYVIDPKTRTVVNKIDETPNCVNGANGMAIGPGHQILLGCAGPGNAEVLNDQTNALTSIPGQGGSDEDWFNPGDGHYFLGMSSAVPPQLGIVDSRSGNVDQDIPTGASAHSVAADPEVNQAYVPIKGGTAHICSAANSSASDANGCVAIFGPSGPDDHPVFVSRNHDHH